MFRLRHLPLHTVCLLILFLKLKRSWFPVALQFHEYGKAIQTYVRVCVHICLSSLFSKTSYYKILTVVPCAVQWELVYLYGVVCTPTKFFIHPLLPLRES